MPHVPIRVKKGVMNEIFFILNTSELRSVKARHSAASLTLLSGNQA